MNLTGSINENKNKIISLVVIIAALIVAGNIYNAQNKELERLKANRDDEAKKNEVLTQISRNEKKIKAYSGFINNKDISSAMNTISSIARESGAKVISLKPAKEQDGSYFTKHPFELVVGMDTYHGLGKFISKLESHPDIYVVELVNTSRGRAASAMGQPYGYGFSNQSSAQEPEKISASLKIYTLLMKNE